MMVDVIIGMIVLAFVALIIGWFLGFFTAAGMNEQDKEDRENGSTKDS